MVIKTSDGFGKVKDEIKPDTVDNSRIVIIIKKIK